MSHSYAEDTTTILLFGDSITAGYNLPEEVALHRVTEERLREEGYDVHVINGGVSGDTSSGGRSRIEWMVKKHQPDIVMVALGGNDMLRAVPPRVTRDNMFAIVDYLVEQDIKVALTSVRAPLNLGLAYGKKFNAIYPDIADDYDLELHPFLLEKIYGKRGMMLSDGIHPSAKGVQVIADDLVPFLETYIE